MVWKRKHISHHKHRHRYLKHGQFRSVKPGIHRGYSIFPLPFLCWSCLCGRCPKGDLHTHRKTLHPSSSVHEMQLVVLLLSRDRCLLPGLTRRRTLAQLGSSLSWEADSWEAARNCFLNPFPAVVCHCPQREVTRSSLSSRRLCKGPKSKYRVCHGPFCHCITVWHSSPSALQFFPPAEQYYCPLFIAYQIFLTYISRIEAVGRLPSVAMLFFIFCPFFFSLTCCKIWLGWNQHRHPLSNFFGGILASSMWSCRIWLI